MKILDWIRIAKISDLFNTIAVPIPYFKANLLFPYVSTPLGATGRYTQVCTFHDGCKQGIDQQIFNRKSISRKIMHPQSLFK